jgi:hypothetical protein
MVQCVCVCTNARLYYGTVCVYERTPTLWYSVCVCIRTHAYIMVQYVCVRMNALPHDRSQNLYTPIYASGVCVYTNTRPYQRGSVSEGNGELWIPIQSNNKGKWLHL